MPIFRIRRYSGYKDGANHYYHADVVARDSKAALRAAKEGRVENWRWVDTFDKSDEDYVRYEFLYRVTNEAKKPECPIPVRIEQLRKRVVTISGVAGAYFIRDRLTHSRRLAVTIFHKMPNTADKVQHLVDGKFPVKLYQLSRRRTMEIQNAP